MTNNPHPKTPAIALLLLAASLAPARAATFEIRRVSEAGDVAASAPVAMVTASPFDDAVTRLIDGADYFYAVIDENGSPLTIAVQRNPVAGGLRVSFDDGHPTSAAVHASASTVMVAPSSIRADGVQSAIATIVPRDADGVALGRGLVVALDPARLWPGRLAGAIEDLGDGTYRAQVVSMVPGAGVVDVTVEGIALAVTPEVSFTAPDPNGSLRDLAILQLRDLISAGGRFSAIGPAGEDAMALAQRGLDHLANGDLLRDDNVLKTDLDAVLKELAPLAEADPSGAFRDLMDDILGIARLIAVYHLDLAETARGVCDGGVPFKVCAADAALVEADAARAEVNPEWSVVVDGYARSVEWSIQAQHEY